MLGCYNAHLDQQDDNPLISITDPKFTDDPWLLLYNSARSALTGKQHLQILKMQRGFFFFSSYPCVWIQGQQTSTLTDKIQVKVITSFLSTDKP